MNSFVRTGLAVIPAAVVAFGLSTAAQAHPQDVWCNPVKGWNDVDVTTTTGSWAIHQGSFVCPPTAPAAVPAPVVQAQTEYLVFFDWDKSTITPAADRVVADAATAIGSGAGAQVHVIGHTDTSGSPAYNQRLSVRRAEAVKSALISKGVPVAGITTEGKGETQLLVPTGPNVREPSNRRAQILPRSVNAPSS